MDWPERLRSGSGRCRRPTWLVTSLSWPSQLGMLDWRALELGAAEIARVRWPRSVPSPATRGTDAWVLVASGLAYRNDCEGFRAPSSLARASASFFGTDATAAGRLT